MLSGLAQNKFLTLTGANPAMEADEPRSKPATVVTGADLSALSVHELEGRILALKQEISRCEAAMVAKKTSAEAASAVFKL